MAARLPDSIGGRASGRRLSRAGTPIRHNRCVINTAVVPTLIENFFVSIFQQSFIY